MTRDVWQFNTMDDLLISFDNDPSENLDVCRITRVEVVGGLVNFTVKFDMSQFLGLLK